MLSPYTTPISKQLVLRYVLENLDFRKRSLYLQEIIHIGKKEECWRKALIAFFDTPFKAKVLSKAALN